MPAGFSQYFIIGQISIGSVEGASCVNLGNNLPSGFQSHKKHNQGFGNVSGDRNSLTETKAYLDDADMLDVFHSPEADLPKWVTDLLPPKAES